MLKDQTVLAKIATTDKDADVRSIAVAMLSAQTVLAEIATTDKDADVRSIAVGKLTDQTVLAKIAKADKDANVRNAAAEQQRLFAVAYNNLAGALRSENAGAQYNAVQALIRSDIGSDTAELLTAAVKDSDYHVRLGAIDAFSHVTVEPFPTDAIIAATKDPNSQVRETAVDVLGQMLSSEGQAVEALTAAMKDSDSHVRYLAATRLGESYSPDAHGVLLAALRDHDMEVIINVYDFFIHQGEPNSEDTLIEALDRSGDLKMAQAFLNCGNSKLEQSALSWAADNHVQIVTGPGTVWTKWGDKR
jgi:HEAT repeat protein